jgi:hypothetical protein
LCHKEISTKEGNQPDDDEQCQPHLQDLQRSWCVHSRCASLEKTKSS